MYYLTAKDAQKLVDCQWGYIYEMRRPENKMDTFDYQMAHTLAKVFKDAARGFTKSEIQTFDRKNNHEMWEKIASNLRELGFDAYSYSDWDNSGTLVIRWEQAEE